MKTLIATQIIFLSLFSGLVEASYEKCVAMANAYAKIYHSSTYDYTPIKKITKNDATLMRLGMDIHKDVRKGPKFTVKSSQEKEIKYFTNKWKSKCESKF